MVRFGWLAVVAIVGGAEARPASAADEVLVPEAHVEEALAEARANRPAMERVLAHFAQAGDPRRLTAARFLIANMPGKGYVVTALKDAQGKVIPYDPLAYPDFRAAEAAYEALEKQHGPLDFARDHLVADLETLTADYLIRHVEGAFEVWEGTPAARRVGFRAFLDFVLPYRGSEEPAEAWLGPLRARLAEARKAPGAPGADADAATLWRWIQGLVGSWVRFNERYYLHPTDQGFGEMGTSCAGRCEDITNMTTYAARALGLATAADYTPAWGHRDNNHAWNVLLDAEGKGSDPAQAHAAKVYRKTFAIQRDALPFVLGKGRAAPNRFLANASQVDVTEQYAPTGAWGSALHEAPASEEIGYACVFNAGEWVPIAWARSEGELGNPRSAAFTRLGRGGRGMLYLSAFHDGQGLHPGWVPAVLHADGRVERLPRNGPAVQVLVTAVAPAQTSVDTHVTTPVSELMEGATYVLQQWGRGRWEAVQEVVAGKEPLRFDDLAADGLYWLVEKGSKRLERPFTIEAGRQRFW